MGQPRMQDRYVGDIGDFGKYGLLRALCRPQFGNERPDLALGVVWYLVPDEKHNGDGKHIRYLGPPYREKFRECDPPLYDALVRIARSGSRSVSTIREAGILPPRTVFFETRLTFRGMPSIGKTAMRLRCDHRGRWADTGLRETDGCDLVFFDPDNGLECRVKRHHGKGPKYVFFDEVEPYLRRGQSLVIYQHIGRNGPAEYQVLQRLHEIDQRLNPHRGSFALLYRRGTTRAFLIVPHEEHEKQLRERVDALLRQDNPWSSLFTPVW